MTAPFLSKTYLLSGGFTLLALLASIPFASPKISLSILVGGVTSLANFMVWQRLVAGWLASDGIPFRRIFPKLLLKVLLVVAILVVIAQFPIHGIGFLVGFSTVIAAIIAGGVVN